jgi:cobalt/nickel transport protein
LENVKAFAAFLLEVQMKQKMKQTMIIVLLILTGIGSLPACGHAHFGMLIPSDTMVMQGDSRTIRVDVSFSHPFEGIGMEMAKPSACSVVANGNKTDLMGSLTKQAVMGHTAWSLDYKISRPGVYTFLVEPEPYWEPTEDAFIIHYTKTVVTAFGDDEGWDREIGLKTEILPLSKPYGLYAGNIFQGIVKLNGKPVPYAKVEVEYYNKDGRLTVPTDYMITQTIKADGNGVFSYAAPVAGWWGFAALNSADFQLSHDGQDKDVELGAVIWVKFQEVILK